MAARFGTTALALAALTAGLSTAAGALDLVGSTQVTLGWSPASGPVSGYYVIVARNNGPAQVESVTIATQKTIAGAYGETLVVRVSAFGANGVAGPVSSPSDPITFVASAPPPPPPPPPDDGGGGVPPPPDPGPDPVPGGSATVARDFNGDGIADLVVRDPSKVHVWAMQGAAVASKIPLPLVPNGTGLVGTGDYDGNHTADLLWENASTGALTLWLLNGGLVAATSKLDRSSLPAGEEWHVGGSADFNGDGADDLLLFSRVKGEVEVWTFSGSAVASRTRHPGHVGAWSVAAARDTDGDGMAEIVWVDELARTLELRDPAAAAPDALGALGAGWRVRGAADLAGYGSAELVLNQTALGTTQAWALDDAGLLGSSNLPNAQALGSFAGSGDFDGDGREDVAWSDASTGAVTLWLAVSTAPTAVVVNRALPAGGEVVSGATTSDDSAFRTRFCSGDLNGSGNVSSTDFARFKKCLDRPRTAACDLADMDSDGFVTEADFAILKLRFRGVLCEAW